VSDLNQAAQIEALRDLVSSQGWKLYREMVIGEISGDFEEHITKALDVPDAAVALDRMRQVAAVRKAGLRWLKLPIERLESLTETVQMHDSIKHQQGRRPLGL
jgi:hypothetical protein